MNLKRRANKKGTVVYLGNGRSKPYAARISVRKRCWWKNNLLRY